MRRRSTFAAASANRPSSSGSTARCRSAWTTAPSSSASPTTSPASGSRSAWPGRSPRRFSIHSRAAELPQQSAAAEPAAGAVEPAAPAAAPARPRRAAGARAAGARAARAAKAAGDLNPRYVFDRFVTGPHNEYATAVAHSVAESPATAYNPVFMYADTGLGKTHLIQAIAHDALYEAGKQIVITSDRPPRELEELEERLRTRFGQGVVVDISRPDLETRIAILRKQVKWEGFQIAEPEVLEWIASRVTTNIRELYGALTRAVSYASIQGSEVTLDVTKEALKDILPKAYQRPVTIETGQAEVARPFGLHVNDLRGNRRTQDVAYARHIAMYLSRDLTEASLPQIGARFGGRHHTTVIHAVDKIERQLKDGHDPQLQDLVALITARLKTVR